MTSSQKNNRTGRLLLLSALCLGFFLVITWLCGIMLSSMKSDLREIRIKSAQSVIVECPALAGRMREMLADGEITEREDRVIDTLVDLEQAKPGGLDSCYPEKS